MNKEYYELSQAKRTAIEKAVAYLFDADIKHFKILHPITTPAGYRHIDTIVVNKEDETVYVSEGVSVKKFKGCPFTEAFVKAKGRADEIDKICDKVIRYSSFNTEEYPVKYECCLFRGHRYEYVFFDEFDDYHEKTGYWGVFVAPKIETLINGKEYLFYQLIPAYKEELMFVEENESTYYSGLCEAIVKQIPERQYLDEKHEMLSKEQLEKILLNYRESGNLK